MTFGERLFKLRKEKGLSQEALAEQLNTTRQAISKWENNQGYRLYEIEDVLRKQKFLRISNSEIVNIRKIADIDLSIIGRVCIRLSGDICVYVSRRYIPKIKKSLGI